MQTELSRNPRSFLFVPASNPARLEKAVASAADAVIADLEDAVAISEKDGARDHLAAFFGKPRKMPIYVRVNAASTEWCWQDLRAVARLPIAGIVLPKAETATDIAIVDWVLTQLERESGRHGAPIRIIPIIETAAGLLGAQEIASACHRIVRVLFGAVDLAADMDLLLSPESEAMKSARYQVAVASRAAGLGSPIDTAFADIDRPEELLRTAHLAASYGYGAKCCIHPSQIEIVNQVFSPTQEQIHWARRVVTAFAEAEVQGVAAIRVDGAMVDYPVLKRARTIVALAGEAHP